MLELKKLEVKQNLYNTDNYLLSNDSLTGDTLNIDFNGIDKGLFLSGTLRPSREQSLVNSLRSGNKITLGGWC